MGGLDRLSCVELSEIPIPIRLVSVYIERDLADESIFETKSLGLAQCAVSSEEPVAARRASARIELQLIWTVMSSNDISSFRMFPSLSSTVICI